MTQSDTIKCYIIQEKGHLHSFLWKRTCETLNTQSPLLQVSPGQVTPVNKTKDSYNKGIKRSIDASLQVLL